jgi:hypothetical protein
MLTGMGQIITIKRLRHWGVLLWLLILLFGRGGAVWGEEVPEYKLKAAYLYNFSTFTTWPDQGKSHFEFCVYGKSPFGAALDHIRGKRTGSLPIKVRTTQTLEGVAGCQLIYIAPSAINKLGQVLGSVAQYPVLTVSDNPGGLEPPFSTVQCSPSVSDNPGGLERGVMINMVTVKGRITFEVNLAEVERHGLKMSSKLLRLAKRIIH